MSRNGFTLVEMMIVIAVAALLAGVVVMTVGNPGPGSEGGGDALRQPYRRRP